MAIKERRENNKVLTRRTRVIEGNSKGLIAVSH